MIEFNTIWQLLLQNGASPRKEEGTRQYWNTLDGAKQQAAFTNISRKLAAQDFVHYDPIRAIKENSWRAKEPQPEWLKGNEGGDIVQVKYHDSFKLCTRDTMEQFGLEWVRDW